MVMSVGRLVTLGERYLTNRGIQSARTASEELLRFVLGKDNKAALYTDVMSSLAPASVRMFMKNIRKRCEGYPLQYITGEVGFLDFVIHVEEGVLIPRPETELLVTKVLERIPEDQDMIALDMGTGTGAIAVSLAYYRPRLSVIAVDIAEGALRIARANAERIGVAGRISFLQSDCFACIPEGVQCDIVVTNPPYIASRECATLPREVCAEPVIALDGGSDGLDMYRHILDEVPLYMQRGGIFAGEIGCTQGRAIQTLLHKQGFSTSTLFRDYAEYDRIIIAER